MRRTLRSLRKSPSLMVGTVLVIICLLLLAQPSLFTTHDPIKTNIGEALQGPSSVHFFGTDNLGRDLFTRTLYGAQVTVFYTLIALLITAAFATLLGGISAYYGGRVDLTLSSLIDGMFAFPDLLVAMLVVATLGPNLRNALVAAGIGTMPAFARMARGLVLSLKHLDYVEAARAVGASNMRILVRHIAPNCLGPLLAFVTLRFSSIVLTVAALGFLGLGAQPPNPELGVLVADGRTYIRSYPHISLLPGLSLGFLVLTFNLFGEGLGDLFAPRRK